MRLITTTVRHNSQPLTGAAADTAVPPPRAAVTVDGVAFPGLPFESVFSSLGPSVVASVLPPSSTWGALFCRELREAGDWIDLNTDASLSTPEWRFEWRLDL